MTVTMVRAQNGGRIVGRSGRKYRLIVARGTCEVCGQAWGVQSVIDPRDPIPEVGYAHDGEAAHHLVMTGDSEAARALREGQVIATHREVASDGPVN